MLVKTSRAEYDPDIDCNLSRLTLISLVRLSHDLPIVFESFSCQLPQTFFKYAHVFLTAEADSLSTDAKQLLEDYGFGGTPLKQKQ